MVGPTPGRVCSRSRLPQPVIAGLDQLRDLLNLAKMVDLAKIPSAVCHIVARDPADMDCKILMLNGLSQMPCRASAISRARILL